MSDPSDKFSASLQASLVFVITSAILVFFADRNGYEGDDLNSIIPMLNLHGFVQQPESIYKYDWQPLAYWVGHAIYVSTGSIVSIFLLPQIAIATGVGMLFTIITRYIGIPGWLFGPILMMFPEILYSGLYYNSSALGFPFAVLAVLLAFAFPRREAAAFIGLSLGIAVTLRVDYALVAPAIVLLRLYLTQNIWDFILAAAVGLLWLGLSFGIGLLDMERMLIVYETSRNEIIARASQGGWNAHTKLRVATVILSPIGWTFLLFSLGHFGWTASRRLWAQAGFLIASLTPFFYSLQNLLSVKYLMPLFVLLPVFAALIWRDMCKRMHPRMCNAIATLWTAASLLLVFIAIEPERSPPYFRITATAPRTIGTHDGQRTWGAYLTGLSRVERNPSDDRQAQRAVLADTFVRLAEVPANREVWLIGERGFFGAGGLGWNLIHVRLERLGYRGTWTRDGTVRFEVPMGRIVMALPESTAPRGACKIILSHETDPAAYVEQYCSG